MSRRFKKTIENFDCGHCYAHILGNGYTNHCPHCLWSKHVDINPGDRLAECGGMMRPISVEIRGQEYILTHKCKKCGHEKRNIASSTDDFESIIKLITQGLQ